MTQGKPIIYKQAPCQPDGWITREHQEESKEGSWQEKRPNQPELTNSSMI